MKVKGLIAFLFLAFSFSQCSDDELKNPNYPVEPSIAYKSIKFIDVLQVNKSDTLKFTISYRDGDSDLGLDFTEINEPYNFTNYFLEDGAGDTTKVATEIVTINNEEYILLKSLGVNGKLVTDETRSKPNYGYLPEYDPDNCDYSQDEILIHSNNIDASYNIKDTIHINEQLHVIIEDQPLLFELNPHSNNIHVDFLVLENGTWTEFDWYDKYCVYFDARFPFIGNETGKIKWLPFKIAAKTPWEGSLTYEMSSTGFVQKFWNKKP